MTLSFLCPRCRCALVGLTCVKCGFAPIVQGPFYDFIADDPDCLHLREEIAFWDKEVLAHPTCRLRPHIDTLADYFSGRSFCRSAGRMLPELRQINLEGKVALEVGGTGHGLAMMIRSGCRRLFHLEVSRHTQELARQNLAKLVQATGADIVYLAAPAEKNPLPDEAVDFLMAFGTYHHTDRCRAVPEIFRVLKSGGAFFIDEGYIGTMLQPLKWLTRTIRRPFGFDPGNDDPLSRRDLKILKAYFPINRYEIRNVLDAAAFVVRYLSPKLGRRMYGAEIDLPGVTALAKDWLKGVLLFSGKKPSQAEGLRA